MSHCLLVYTNALGNCSLESALVPVTLKGSQFLESDLNIYPRSVSLKTTKIIDTDVKNGLHIAIAAWMEREIKLTNTKKSDKFLSTKHPDINGFATHVPVNRTQSRS